MVEAALVNTSVYPAPALEDYASGRNLVPPAWRRLNVILDIASWVCVNVHFAQKMFLPVLTVARCPMFV